MISIDFIRRDRDSWRILAERANHRADQEAAEIMRLLEAEREMMRLLDLIDAEWRSDPMSVQCFDLRIVADVRKVVIAWREREKKNNEQQD